MDKGKESIPKSSVEELQAEQQHADAQIEQATTVASATNVSAPTAAETSDPSLKLTTPPGSSQVEAEGVEDLPKAKPQTLQELQAQEVDAGKKVKKSATKPKPVKDFTPVYTDEEKVHLQKVTEVCKAEIEAAPAKYGAIPFGNNAIISLKDFYKGGGDFATPVVNRTHGNDQKTTGESLLSFGSQHPLMVITVSMANVSGIACERFANDPDQDKPVSDALVLLDGNGRINYLLTVDVEKWPDVWAVFPSQDAVGYFNLPLAFDMINTKVSVWKTQDLASKRCMMDGEKAHPGWKKIVDLVNNHKYKYQAACIRTTLDKDRLKKDDVNMGDPNLLFKYYDSAVLVFDAVDKKFGDKSDAVLMNKAVPMCVSAIWSKCRDKFGQEEGTDHFVKFIESLDAEVVKRIVEAKTNKGGTTRDVKRTSELENAFEAYVSKKGIEL